MLECGCHAFDFLCGKAGRGGGFTPARDGGADFMRDDLRPLGLYAEMRRNLESEIERCRAIGFVNGRRQDAGLDIDRNGICLQKTGHELMPWSKLVALLLLVQLRGRETDAGLRYLPGGLPGLRGPDIPIAHKIVLRTAAKKGLLIGYVQILGVLGVAGILADKGLPSLIAQISANWRGKNNQESVMHRSAFLGGRRPKYP